MNSTRALLFASAVLLPLAACRQSTCPLLCRPATCVQAADCDGLPVDDDCRGHWECVGGDCLRACDAYPCSAAEDCRERPWPEQCWGEWTCPGGECRAECRGTPCDDDGDCAGLAWTKSCPGGWLCRAGRCLDVCQGDGCAGWADCMRLPWTEQCNGNWVCQAGACLAVCDVTSCEEEIPFHQPVLDGEGKLLAWDSFDRVIRLAMDFVFDCPADETTGLPWYMQYCDFNPELMLPDPWPHNPAGLYGMMVETARRYFAYSGERRWIDFVRRPLAQLAAESTPADFLWPRVPYASADNSGHFYGGSAEGVEGIQPDKVAQAAVGYLRFFKLSGEWKYLYQALHCANVLAKNVREGDEAHSPWPFRLNARTGAVIEEYSSDVVWPLVLFEEIERLELSTPTMAQAHQLAWDWLLAHPLENMLWKGYFEDVTIDEHNINREQYTAGETARYLMQRHRDDPRLAEQVPALLDWIKNSFGDDSAKFHGATGIREQFFCPQIASSHTARYGSVCAMWAALGGGESCGEEARRALSLATYFARDDGAVIFSICDRDVWFSDGYFDFVPHFLDAMAALPELAPAGEDHLLGSTSVINDISYAAGEIRYRAFHAGGEEVLRLSFAPALVLCGGKKLSQTPAGSPGEGYQYDAGSGALHISRTSCAEITISDH